VSLLAAITLFGLQAIDRCYADEVKILPLRISVTECLIFESDESVFTLNFKDFVRGAKTKTSTGRYKLIANNVHRTQDVVMARFEPIAGFGPKKGVKDEIALEADFRKFHKVFGNAVLIESNSGFISLGEREIGLADKVVQSGRGKLINGVFQIRYRATALRDLEAGNRTGRLILTFMDT
jgi:hypothetical protein